jgi:DNA-binding MarR family transcriptional regulator
MPKQIMNIEESINFYFLMHNKLFKSIEENLNNQKSSTKEIFILNFINENSLINQKQLSDLMTMNRTSMTLAIDALQKKNFAKRKSLAHDRRQNIIEITESGRVFLKANLAEINYMVNDFLTTLSPGEENKRSVSELEVLNFIIQKSFLKTY